MEKPSGSPVLLRACPSCTRPIEIDHTYCEICGAKMPELPACSNCGARFIAPVKFCERCGTPVLPLTNPERTNGEIPEPDERLHLPMSKKSGAAEKAPVPASTGPDLSATVDDALFFLSDDKPVPVQPKVDRLYRTGGIVLITILLAAIWFIGLPMLTGGGGADGPGTPAAGVTSVPGLVTVSTTGPPLTETVIPVPVSDALVPKPTQLVPEGQIVRFLVQKDPVTARITVTLAGGPGADSISSSEVKVTHPDGAVASGVILPFKGSTEIIVDGSKGTDRVEIIAKMNDGRTYRVYDELIPFRG